MRVGVMVVAAVLAVCPPALAQPGPSTVAGRLVESEVLSQVAKGELSQAEAESFLHHAADAGRIDHAEFSRIFDRLKGEFEKLAKEKKEQNPVFNADWSWGSVFVGSDYKTTLSVHNGCSTAQAVSITYPGSLSLSGPGGVTVPAQSQVDVPLELELSKLQIPPQPIPVDPGCPIVTGALKVEHPRAGRCLEMKRSYLIGMQVHFHPPPGDKKGGGGGGKPRSSVCETLWRQREFFPTKDTLTPLACTGEMRTLAADYVDTTLAPYRSQDPGAWSWLPTREQIGRMSNAALLDLKAQAEAQLAAGVGTTGR